MAKFRSKYNHGKPEKIGDSFSKHRPKRKLVVEEDGTKTLDYVKDPETGEVQTEDVYAQVQEEKDMCVVLTEQGAMRGGYKIDLKDKKLQKGKFGDFRNVPKDAGELLARAKWAKQVTSSMLNEDGSLKETWIQRDDVPSVKDIADGKHDTKPEDKKTKETKEEK